jgi:hypothetical protein
VVAGAGTALLVFLPPRRRVQALLGGGVDLFASRAELLVHGRPALATERASFWIGAGMALGVGR